MDTHTWAAVVVLMITSLMPTRSAAEKPKG